MGSGFQPGQEVALLLEVETPDFEGRLQLMDIREPGGTLDPLPKANDSGNWASVWTLDRYVKKGILTTEVYGIRAANPDTYETLATAPIAFADTEKPVEDLPSWARLGLGE